MLAHDTYMSFTTSEMPSAVNCTTGYLSKDTRTLSESKSELMITILSVGQPEYWINIHFSLRYAVWLQSGKKLVMRSCAVFAVFSLEYVGFSLLWRSFVSNEANYRTWIIKDLLVSAEFRRPKWNPALSLSVCTVVCFISIYSIMPTHRCHTS